ncbi:MAG: ABC transporter permease [Bacteroidota bacterium]|nr:ABC transporter permease [Bacteroidota bacterium]
MNKSKKVFLTPGKIKPHVNKAYLKNLIPGSTSLFLEEISGIFLFALRFLKSVFFPPLELKEFTKQAYEVGYKSLILVGITGFIMGLVLTIQSRPTLAEFGAQSMLPAMVAISIVREIGPVITALIFAGRVGSGIGAELGSMKVTEQIDAMEVSGINPFKYLIVTRVLATTLMVPVLVFFADAIGLVGSFVGINIQGEVSFTLYITQVFGALDFADILPATIKSFLFGFAIGIIACYKGYTSEKGTEGVGKAANSAVVISSLSIFIIDMMAVQITDLIWK